jgi:glycosyltransferase involved in cell wall biosynthesis
MRILLLSTSMGMGGADKQILTAAEQMRAEGHELLIISLTELGPMGLEARSLGIPTESLEMSRGVADPRALVRLIRLVRSWKPDVVHSHMVHANLMARVLRLFVRVPAVVSTIHNIHEGGAHLMLGYRLSNALVDQMTVVSEAAAERFVRERIVPRELLRVIPNGVDVDLYANIPPGTRESLRRALGVDRAFVWLAVGRFEVAKDYPTMLRAFARVREREPGAVLLLVGRGSLQAETEALARELGVEGSVRFLGVRNDVPEIMTTADGYVMSSQWEGMPMVLLEAAAAALPIVATQVGGNQEVVRHDESGFLVPPSDADALSRAMLRLMGLAELQRRAMGQRGRDHVERHYGLHRTVERWKEVYREVLSREGTVPSPPSSPSAAALAREPGIDSGATTGGHR